MHHYRVVVGEPKDEEHVAWLRQLDHQLTGVMTTRRRPPATATVPSAVTMPPAPSWWIDDEDASESSLAATRQM